MRVSIDEQHIAMPKLYGAPAYGRPPVPVVKVSRPFDPDELPIEAQQTDEEREFSATLPAKAYAPGGVDLRQAGRAETSTSTGLRPRAFSLRGLAGKIPRG
jgi:hypothetical protein